MTNLNVAVAPMVGPLSILTEEFPAKLSAFNELTRDLREVGIAVQHLVFLDNRIFIEPDSVGLFLRRFGDQLRGIRYVPSGKFTCNSVAVRGVDVVWLSLVKEQDK
ncbi:hypothetical protein ACYZT7_07630 [Pseudomonas sp. RT4P38]